MASIQARADGGWIENRSYVTECAEVDNVNIPIFFTNVTAYRITATTPAYYPVAMDIREPDFSECAFAETRVIWSIGTNDNSAAEFLQTVTGASNEYYALDDPPAGIDQAWTSFPKEINNHTTFDEYIRFTAAESGDANTELTIGANLTIDAVVADGTLQVRMETWDGAGWVDRGSRYITPAALTQTWSIPDFTWLEGVDANRIHLQVEPTGSTAGAWAVFDYIELRKRNESGSTETTLYNDGLVHVQSVAIDFWWRAPQAMKIGVLGGSTNNNAHYLRITRKEPTGDGYNEIFVLYEDGNARIIPFPPVSLPSVPYGASVILGPTVEGARPFSPIDVLTVDPKDLSIDIQYEGGATAHIELYVDRERSVVDVSGITYNTTTQSFARLRSMYVHDGKTDLDRVRCAAGIYPILDGWTTLGGTWWDFFHQVPSYHNTYCPDFRVDVVGPSQAFLAREAETLDSGVNGTVVARPGASGGSAVAISATGGEAVFQVELNELYPATSLLVHYSDADGGDNGTNLGNRIDLYVDGAWTARAYTANTGGSNLFETLSALRAGDLFPGSHTIRLVVGPGTGGAELDWIEFVSQPGVLLVTNSLVTRQGESADSGSGFTFSNRASAVGGMSLAMATNGGVANYDLSLASPATSLYLRVRHADVWNPTKLEVSVDGNLVAKTPSMTAGTLTVKNAGFDTGPGLGGVPDNWFAAGNCGQEWWAGESHSGVAFYGWVNNAAGYFGQEVNVNPLYGDVFTFAMRGLYEPPFETTTGVVRLKLEFWVRGEGAARSTAERNVYADLRQVSNVWQLITVSATNGDADVDMVKIVADFNGVTNKGGVIKWDNAQLFQGRGAGAGYFADAGLMYLGDLSSGSHTVTLTSAAETLGMEVDEFEILGLSRSNRAPRVIAPAGFILPVGASTSFVVQLLEFDPDPVTITAVGAPAGSTFGTNTFAWTAGAGFAGSTNIVAFTADDQQGYANSVAASNVDIVVPYDWDLDDMDDGWEWTWFATLTNAADGDVDGDELSNLGELIAGTEPDSASSFFRVAAVGEDLSMTGRAVTVATEPGRLYSISYRDAQSDGVAWSAFANPAVGLWLETGTVAAAHTFIDDETTNTTAAAPVSGVRVYRVDVSRP